VQCDGQITKPEQNVRMYTFKPERMVEYDFLPVGSAVGTRVGLSLGARVGTIVGSVVGACRQITQLSVIDVPTLDRPGACVG
jgi:hypothetical protein